MFRRYIPSFRSNLLALNFSHGGTSSDNPSLQTFQNNGAPLGPCTLESDSRSYTRVPFATRKTVLVYPPETGRKVRERERRGDEGGVTTLLFKRGIRNIRSVKVSK
jgi:hypothetical protein